MKTKLFLITDYFPYGTGETFIMTELQRLCVEFDVTVIPRYNSNGATLRSLPDGVQVIDGPRFPTVGTMLKAIISFFFSGKGRRELMTALTSGEKCMKRAVKSLSAWIMAENIWRHLKHCGVVEQSRGAVFYSFWYTAAALALSHHRSQLPDSRVIVRLHGYDLYNERATAGRQPFKPAADVGMDRLVFCCDYGRNYYRDVFGVELTEKYQTIAIGTDDTCGEIIPERSESLRLVSCSAAVAVKRIDRIIDALAEIDDFSVEWLHIGGGALLEELKARAEKKLSEKPNVRWSFTGGVSNEEVMSIYRSRVFDGFITTSATEGSPVSIQEALSYGIPVVATAVGGIPEMLADTDNCMLSSESKPIETAAVLRALHNVPEEKRISIRKENRRRWEERFSADNNMKMLTQEINSLWVEREL